MMVSLLSFVLLTTVSVTIGAEVSESCPAGATKCGAEDDSEDPPATNLVQRNFQFKKEKLNAGPSAGVSVVRSSEATMRDRARVRLGIEKDLSRMDSKSYRAWDATQNCTENTGSAFDHFIDHSGLDTELSVAEVGNWKIRVIDEMEAMCKELQEDDVEYQAEAWSFDFMKALENQKPSISEALADSINGAVLGFTVAFQDWMLSESAQKLFDRCGKVSSSAQNTTAFLQTKKYYAKHYDTALQQDTPEAFDPATQWPECGDVFTRIHNQGVCGSCWAFGAMSAVDSRVCIASSGSFQGQLSRGTIASCATANGCMGGLSSTAYNYLGDSRRPGVPTGGSAGCRPYFAHGEGTDHFQQSMPAPPCPVVCQPSYPRAFSQDAVVLGGILNYREIWPRNPAADVDAKVAMMTYGPCPYGIHANSALFGYSEGIFNSGCGNQPNHEVTAYGWGNDGEDFWYSLNSWGDSWGEGGRMRVRTCVITDWTIPGDITHDVQSQMGDNMPFGPTSPTPAPPPTPPPPPTPEPQYAISGPCHVDADACVSSPNYPQDYGNGQFCQIDGFPTFSVEDWGTESGYDKLCVNGECFHGDSQPPPPVVTPTTAITWTSDGSVVSSGWKICPAEDAPPVTPAPTTAPAPTPAPGSSRPSAVWTVVSGDCVADGACVQSPHFPANYGNGESCDISVPANNVHAIQVEAFNTEANFDFLYVNGAGFHGAHTPQGVVPIVALQWISDGSVVRGGWKICLEDTGHVEACTESDNCLGCTEDGDHNPVSGATGACAYDADHLPHGECRLVVGDNHCQIGADACPVISQDGQCGPSHDHALCSVDFFSWAVHCNEASGWCGDSSAHSTAQASTTYDDVSIPSHCRPGNDTDDDDGAGTCDEALCCPQFHANGGCAAMAAGEDPSSMVPPGCMECPQAAAVACCSQWVAPPVLREHGCPRLGDNLVANANLTSRSQATQCCTGNSGDGLHSVHCVRDAFFWGGTYEESKMQCEDYGYRLCDIHELGKCCGQGFGMDRKKVWAMGTTQLP